MGVKVVTDSVSDIPSGVAKELGITVVPLYVHFGTESYRDSIDLTADKFYHKLVHSNTLPSTSVPAIGTFVEVYDRLAKETDEILVITVSSKLSATYEAASQAIGLMKRDCRVKVIDSLLAVMAEGLVVIAAAGAAKGGAGLDEMADITQRNIKRAGFRAAFDTLEYLRRGGRIGKAQAFLGSVLKVNPIITLKDGLVEPAGRERSRSRAIENLYRFATGYSHIEGMAIEDAACPDDAKVLAERLSSDFPNGHIYRVRASPVVGTHAGPGLLVVSVLGDRG
ncbi:DegV family protein [Chloroflexota bacterium]